MGGCVGLAGGIAASHSVGTGHLDPGIIFDVLTIVVVGERRVGWFGAMWRTAVGLGIIATISNGFVLLTSARISVDHQGLDYRCGVGARHWLDPSGTDEMK